MHYLCKLLCVCEFFYAYLNVSNYIIFLKKVWIKEEDPHLNLQATLTVF